MNNQPPHDPRSAGSMAPTQPDPFSYNNPRSQPSTTSEPGASNIQQLTSLPQKADAASWNNPTVSSRHYGHAQFASQDPSSNSAFDTPYHQNMQPVSPNPFGSSNFYTPVNSATMQMFQNWRTAQYGYGPGMQYSGQQYPVQQTLMHYTPFQQTTFQQTPVQQAPGQSQSDEKPDTQAVAAYPDNYADFDMEDDPSAQLMAELTQDIPEPVRSPTPQARQSLEATNNGYQDVDQGWGVSMVNAAGLGVGDSMFAAPQDFHVPEYEVFRNFEYGNPANEVEKMQERQLADQVDQVVAGFNDENMQDAVPEKHTVINRSHDYSYTTPLANRHYDIQLYTEDHTEDSAPERDNFTSADNIDQLEDFTVEPLEVSGDVVEKRVAEEDTMQDGVPEQHAIESDNVQDDVAEDNVSEEDITEGNAGEDNCAEHEDEDADISDAGPSSGQEAHDSGVEVPPQVEFEGFMLTESPLKTIKKSIMKKEDEELHHKASKLQPHHLPAHRYWIAILMHTVQPSKAKVEKDFIWLKGSRINTVETMWNKYREVTTEEQHQILFCGRVPQFTDTLEELDVCDDKLIVFRAAKQEVIVID